MIITCTYINTKMHNAKNRDIEDPRIILQTSLQAFAGEMTVDVDETSVVTGLDNDAVLIVLNIDSITVVD